MRYFLSFLFSLVFTFSFCQIPDTVITTDIYKSYFSYDIKSTIFVKYKLYQGGGDCSRSNYKFKNDTKINMIHNKDYRKSGYDRGHLANAEDFAFDCNKIEQTFRLYNCIPQTPNLNRGNFKKDESLIRRLSKTDSLLIMTGGIFINKTSPNGLIIVPDYCFKIVKNLKTNNIIYVILYKNDDASTRTIITIDELNLIHHEDIDYLEYISDY